ncbi:MAG: OadG family protein [Desulfatitalea sp.]|nr:OadG family protein [Desulfatitalea sp.]NNK00104.1 OadG family protein [Desulfatitalea sp.]
MHLDFGLIAANNGWAMAIAGAIIVILGLTTLSFIISQLHKIIALFEQKQITPEPATPACCTDHGEADIDFLNDLDASARLYQVLSDDLGNSFDIAKLYQRSHRDQLPHPHITIRALRETGYLIPQGDGRFSWKND